MLSVDTILEKSNENIDGITVSGGEPFEQYEGLLALLKRAKAIELNTIVFSGHTYEHIQEHFFECLNYIDVLIDGEYIDEKRSFRFPLIGSTNQQIRCLSDVYRVDDFKQNTVEIRIRKNGSIQINGMCEFDEIKKKW